MLCTCCVVVVLQCDGISGILTNNVIYSFKRNHVHRHG